jgi:hypothetical protein
MGSEAAPVRPTLPPPASAPGPSWERIARPGFAGAYLTYRLRIGFSRDVDWSEARSVIEKAYALENESYLAQGRSITLEPRRLTLRVFGTASDLPGDDDKLQTRLLVLVLEQLREHLQSVGTERWTDTPFEEPPEKTHGQADGIWLLERLVRDTLGIQVVELDYYRPRLWGGDAANPELRITLEGPVERSFGARLNWIPATIFVPPGRYRLSAMAPAFGLPEYRGKLKRFARETIFVSRVLELEGAAGEILQLRMGVPEEKRRLPPEHAAFFDQWRVPEQEQKPPPPPLCEIVIEVVKA